MKKKLTYSPRDVDASWALFVFLIVQCWIHHLHLLFFSHPRRPPRHVLLPFLLSHVIVHPCPHLCHCPVAVVLVVMLWLSLLSCGGCPPPHLSHCLSLSPGPHHHCCHCHLSPCCRCQCRPVLLFLSSWLPFFFVVASSLSLPCQLFLPCKQLLMAVGCWWLSSSLPCHPLSLPHCLCHRMLPCFVVVLIHHPPHEQVLIAMKLLWVCCLVVNSIDRT